MGHTPFGHKGEEFLNELYFEHTGRYFNHNVHSVRVLQKITGCNLTLQTLDGILCHCGEKAFGKYEPHSVHTFAEYNEMVEKCYTQQGYIDNRRPSTLEGCAVRISDMIAYLGKDRQDARKVKLPFNGRDTVLGTNNAEIITSVVADLVVNSLDKPYISLSEDVFECLKAMREENNDQIYQCDVVTGPYYAIIKPMMRLMYERFLEELRLENHKSLIYLHYLNNKIIGRFYFKDNMKKRIVQTDQHELNDIVTDFIASMTDDYFIDAFSYLFPDNELVKKVRYVEYFDERYMR